MPSNVKDYKETLFLPNTNFPMRANLPEREKEGLARWEKLNIYKRLRKDFGNRKDFVLHDGPPYANGNLHIGHALNKILKDFVARKTNLYINKAKKERNKHTQCPPMKIFMVDIPMKKKKMI